jgi:hypothetical protein
MMKANGWFRKRSEKGSQEAEQKNDGNDEDRCGEMGERSATRKHHPGSHRPVFV